MKKDIIETLVEDFSTLNLSAPLLRAIADLGYTKPSEIQAKALPILLDEPTDFLGLAATGTGKTAAFGIPLLERIDPANRSIQGLILCPTRELAIQVAGQIELLGKHKGVRAIAVYGGAGYGEQISGLKKRPAVVVGTPGRLIDHLEKGTLSIDSVETVILDEADEMISMGFKDDLELILKQVPRESSNIWLFSATMSSEVRHVADEYLQNPRQVQVNRQEMLSSTVKQIFYVTQESNKPEVLCKLIDMAEDFYGLVFFQTKVILVEMFQYLKQRGYAVECLHGDMEQPARERMMKLFRERKVTILLCTDVASRGLDVKDVSHVINYSVPRELDNYVHRIGRTARSGKNGLAMSLVSGSQRGLIGRIERATKSKMIEGKIPTRKEIGTKKVADVLKGFETQANSQRAVDLLSPEWKAALKELDGEAIAGRFLSMMYPEVFNERPEVESTRAVIRAVKTTEDQSEGYRQRKSSAPWGRREGRPGFGGGSRPARGGDDYAPRASAGPRFGGGPKPLAARPSRGPTPRPMNLPKADQSSGGYGKIKKKSDRV